jgi:hypothetical protein
VVSVTPHVVVEVRGGVVTAVCGNQKDVAVTVVDWDAIDTWDGSIGDDVAGVLTAIAREVDVAQVPSPAVLGACPCLFNYGALHSRSRRKSMAEAREIKLDDRELALVLCGLRMLEAYAGSGVGDPLAAMADAHELILAREGYSGVDSDEIQALCERLNCNEERSDPWRK